VTFIKKIQLYVYVLMSEYVLMYMLSSYQFNTEWCETFHFIGFKEVTEGCCGSTVLNAAVFIQYQPACPNVHDYIFWDSFHPTEKAYNIVVDKVLHQNLHYLIWRNSLLYLTRNEISLKVESFLLSKWVNTSTV
jgi:hypothetical protein